MTWVKRIAATALTALGILVAGVHAVPAYADDDGDLVQQQLRDSLQQMEESEQEAEQQNEAAQQQAQLDEQLAQSDQQPGQ